MSPRGWAIRVARSISVVPMASLAVVTDCSDDPAQDVNAALKFPGADEACDGLDNDCDGTVDEDAARSIEAVPVLALPWTVASAQQAGKLVALASGDNTQPRAGVGSMSDGQWRWQPVAGYCPTDPEQLDGTTPPVCAFAELAVAEAANQRLAVGINVSGCAAGQVRLGFIDGESGELRSADDPQDPKRHASNLLFGVDVPGEGLPCTGGNRSMSQPVGGTRPTLAVLAGVEEALLTTSDRGIVEGLAAWLADAHGRDQCGGDDVNIEAMGLWLVRGVRNPGFVNWVAGTGAAMAQVVGSTRAGGAPAIAPVEGRLAGYVMAYADGEGQIQLAFFPRLGEIVPNTSLQRQAMLRMQVNDADHIALASGPAALVCSGQPGQLIAVAWQQGCDTAAPQVRFALVGLTNDRAELCTMSEEIELGRGPSGGLSMQPSLTYVAQGISAGTGHVGTGDLHVHGGGWYVGWLRGDRIAVRRVASPEGRPADATDWLLAPSVQSSVRPMLRDAPEGVIALVVSDTTLASVRLDCGHL